MDATKTKKRKVPPKHLKKSEAPRRREKRREARGGAAIPEIHKQQQPLRPAMDSTKYFYERLLPFAERSHEQNRRRMRAGVRWLFVLPVLLYIIRNMTDSSKVAFLIFWIIGMFAISAVLVYVAYIDDELQKSLNELHNGMPESDQTELGKLQLMDGELEQKLRMGLEREKERLRAAEKETADA